MKIGTFVGKEFIKLTADEKNAIIAEVNKAYPNINVKDMKIIETDNKYMQMLHIDLFLFDGVSTFRDDANNTVIPKHLLISICHQRGYDEAEVGKCYEWEDGFTPEYNLTSFSCSITLHGDEREYKHKHFQKGVGLKNTYSYGSELDDLEIFTNLTKIQKYINNFRPVKK